MSKSSSVALSIRGVTKRFGNHLAVDNVSFEVPTGVVYGVLGPNGAGKSTMLRMLADIIAPDTGSIRFFDGALPPGPSACARIGYLPEERGLYPKMKVGEMVRFIAELRGMSSVDAKRRSGTWLERLGLSSWVDNKVQDLSKGMQQKVQFATAFIHEPELVILDEPWSGLDPINAEVLRDVVDELRDAGKTILFSTHGMAQAEELCDYVCIIARGRRVLDGKLADIRSDAAATRRVAVSFENETSAQAAAVVLADVQLITRRLEVGDGGSTESRPVVELAANATPQQLLAALISAGVSLRLFEVVTPTLHQVFVDRVGADNARVAIRSDEQEAS